jgi:hypothetical protein
MSQVVRGQTYPWVAQVRDGDHLPTDASTLQLLVLDPSGHVVDGFPVDLASMVRDDLGRYHYNWAVPALADTGTYLATWTGTLTSGTIGPTNDSVDVVLAGSIVVSSPSAGSSYLMPGRFASMGLGISLTGYSDFEIWNLLQQATDVVNAYCNQPLLPTPGSFLGGFAEREEHRWRFPQSSTDRGTRRVYPKHWPIIDVSYFGIRVGHDAEAPIPPQYLVINNAERWAEVSALTIQNSSALFGVSGWVVPMGGLREPIGIISYTYGHRISLTGQRLFATAPDGLAYQAPDGMWSPAYPVVVSAGGVAQDESTYSLDYDDGRVTFASTVPAGVLTIAYTTRLARDIATATGIVAGHIIGESKLRQRNMEGLDQLKVNEVTAVRQRRMRGDNPADLAIWAPDAALLLAGYRHWSQA